MNEERVASIPHKLGEETVILEREEGEFPKENGERQSNGIEVENESIRSADRPDVVDYPGKSRFNPILITRQLLFILLDCSRLGMLLNVDEQEPKH